MTAADATAKDHGKDKNMSELNPQPLPPREVAVTVHLPGAVLGDLESFQKVQASIFDRFGCGGCNSGIPATPASAWRDGQSRAFTVWLEAQPELVALIA